MKFQFLLLGALFSSSSLASVISLTDIIKSKSVQKVPANCLKADQNNLCSTCIQGYEINSGVCSKINALSADFQPASDYIPCKNQSSCGEAKQFKSDQQFTDFVNKHTPQATGNKNNIYIKSGAVANDLNLAPVPQMQAFSTEGAISAKSASIAPAAKALPSVDPSRDFSGTNNQVNGVDEADLLKTDGTYIYTISNQVLSITLAYPVNKAKVVSKLNFKDIYPSALFIEGDYLAVFGTKYDTKYYDCPYYNYPIYYARSGIEPLKANLDLQTNQGIAANSKFAAPSSMIYRPNYQCSYSVPLTFVKIYNVGNRARPFLMKQYQIAGNYFNARKLDNGFMYIITSHDFSYIRRPWFDFGAGKKDVSFNSIFWYPGIYKNPSAVNIVSFNLANPISCTKKITTVCAQYANNMYMSDRHIYLTTSSWENGLEFTKIRKIFVQGNYIKPFADGKVSGSINNQFSMDQYGQFFRVATTTSSNGSTSNNIYTLNYFLNPYGNLTGLAPGQRIFATRYVGKRCYMVTFRQVDPFFVISLSNHKKPVVLGQLKVPGFSRYLHPYDEETIIGLGRDADANGRQTGLKIGLFDVSDPTQPKEVCQPFALKQTYASSNAQWQHKAFLFSAQKNLMVIPGSMNSGAASFNGAFIFKITKNSINLSNVVDHLLAPSDNFWQRGVERSLYIQDILYTKSQCLIRINKLDGDCSALKNINIPCDIKQFESIIVKPLPIRPMPVIDPILLPMDTSVVKTLPIIKSQVIESIQVPQPGLPTNQASAPL